MTAALRRFASLVALALAGILFASCSPSPEESAPVSACQLPPQIEVPANLPSDFPWPDGVSLTRARSKKKFVSLEGFSKLSVDELFKGSRPTLTTNGFDIINSDYEGFEAELYFAKGDSLAGILSMREGPCDGHVKVNVIYDPLETAAGREAVKKTRELSGES